MFPIETLPRVFIESSLIAGVSSISVRLCYVAVEMLRYIMHVYACAYIRNLVTLLISLHDEIKFYLSFFSFLSRRSRRSSSSFESNGFSLCVEARLITPSNFYEPISMNSVAVVVVVVAC